MKTLWEWGTAILVPSIGWTKMLKAVAKEDNSTTVKEFVNTVPKAAKTASIAVNMIIIFLAVFGVLYVKHKYFGGRRAYR